MSALKMILIAGALSGAVAGVSAAPALAADMGGVRIEDAAARVVVIAENRGDYQISINQGRAGLKPLTLRKDGGVTVVDGGYGRSTGILHFGWNGLNCKGPTGHERVSVPGHMGDIALSDLPVVTIHAPMNARIGSSGAVYGEVSTTSSLDLSGAGCGDWRVADVHGPARIAQSGSGDVRVGSTGDAHVAISGSSDVVLGPVNGRLETATSGSGDIHAASARGGIASKIAGSGDVTVDGGDASQVSVSIAGSGDFKFHGTAGAVSVNIAGSGDVDIARATGPVSKHVVGSGDVNIGS